MADAVEDIEAHAAAKKGGSSSLQTAKDLFSGAAGGVAQVLIGQPFDIVKVRLQTSTAYPSAAAAATSIWKNEGPLAFYKGTLMPLLGIGACVSIQFGAFHWARRSLESYNASRDAPFVPGTSRLGYGQYYLAGAFAGVANTVLSVPIEHVRIRLQTQPDGAAARLYRGPWDCVRQLAGRGALYRGSAVTVLREAQAYGFWFLTFEWLMSADAAPRDRIPPWKVALYGGLAGEALWLSSYPFDVVKSKMQTDGFGGQPQRYRNMRDCFAQTWRAEGMAGFWKGIGPTLLRAMPVSAGTFAVVEMTMRALG